MSFSRSLIFAGDPCACQWLSQAKEHPTTPHIGSHLLLETESLASQHTASVIWHGCSVATKRSLFPTLPLPYLQLDLIKINDNSKRNLEQELNGYKLDAQRQAKQIWALEREREAYGAQVGNNCLPG